jgi:hypothetical protein
MILKETIEHYRRNNSTVYCVMLDVTKTFDRVNYVKLVQLLITKLRKSSHTVEHLLVSFYFGYLELQPFVKFSCA